MALGRSNATPDCLLNANVENVVPRAPLGYPAQWTGIIWMDQAGYFGESDMSSGAASLALSFGDSKFDEAARSITVGVTGKSWTHRNSAYGYLQFLAAYVTGYLYYFEFSPDYSYAQIYPGIAPFGSWLGTWYLPKAFVNWSIELQDTSGKICPPQQNASATKVQNRECAKWLRRSSTFDFISPISELIGVSYYPCYEIVDSGGKRVKPYYDAYISYANSVSEPDEISASVLLDLDLAEASCQKGQSSIVGKEAWSTL
eukprot:TRINITY_DN115283_c0_g1_i1.p1 TRINITY_DN115283_c0_g1~~TRINITY_DN115283_c0_g1_i1.p1  ORF type:complete len:291 (+),score=22.42 TRINITY_DN115283_c0_g1_i1:100-873(+)